MLILPKLPPRVIPCLLLNEGAFVKTTQFKKPVYIGDPINTINLFNKFEVDEIVVLDIGCSRNNSSPDFALIEELASECWVPLAYGGGIQTVADAKIILNSGIEKIIIDRLIFSNPTEVQKCVSEFGASSIVACINIKKSLWGQYQVWTNTGRDKVNLSLNEVLEHIQKLAVGELIINNIQREGTRQGYDLNLTMIISHQLDIPVVTLGGAGSMSDFKLAINAGASAVAAGSYFVFQNNQSSSMLISYPNRNDLESLFYE